MTRKEEILNKAIEFVDKNYMDVGIKTAHEASVAACQEIAEWADKTMIDKACEWMSSHLQMQYSGFSDFIKDFRKAMKGK